MTQYMPCHSTAFQSLQEICLENLECLKQVVLFAVTCESIDFSDFADFKVAFLS